MYIVYVHNLHHSVSCNITDIILVTYIVSCVRDELKGNNIIC